MKELIAATLFMAALACVTGCKHVNFEWDWQPLLESVVARFQK